MYKISTPCLWLTVSFFLPSTILATESDLESAYKTRVQPLVQKYCVECHNEKVSEAEIDFTNMNSIEEIRRTAKTWQRVHEVVETQQMPPKDAPQWSDADREVMVQWTQSFLRAEAAATAGDPGPVLLRRLNNAELTYTLRDLTGLQQLDPTREFPVDGAAGEGFTNASTALSMSPALVSKYLDAAKAVSKHLVLLPNGTKFSTNTTPSDWTNDTVAAIRELYARYSDQSGGSSVNLQGIVFDTNQGGRLPVEQYVAALYEARSQLRTKSLTIEQLASNRKLNSRYLARLWDTLEVDQDQSFALAAIQRDWREAKIDAAGLSAQIAQWQKAMWRFSSIGHIGKVNGSKAWQEPVSPITSRQELRTKIATSPDKDVVTYYLTVGDAGDGNQGDFAVIERPRLVMEGRPDMLLRDVQPVLSKLQEERATFLANTQLALAAAAEAQRSNQGIDVAELSSKFKVRKETLIAWLDYLGINAAGEVRIGNLLQRKMESGAGYDFVKGWVGDDALSVIANSSDQHVRVPGNMLPHSVAVHPSPTQSVVIGWKCSTPVSLTLEGFAQHAHPECGNGVAWSVELRRGNTRQTLASGVAQGPSRVAFGPTGKTAVQPGDLIAFVVSPRDGNHSCDLTTVDMKLNAGEQNWHLAGEIAPDILSANPHADSSQKSTPWVFFSEPATAPSGHVIPTGSLLAKWQSATSPDQQKQLALDIELLLTNGADKLAVDSADRALYQQLTSLGGPLMGAALRAALSAPATADQKNNQEFGLSPKLFGKHPNGTDVEPASLCVQAPTVIEIKLPRDLVAGAEFIASGYLHGGTGNEGSVQVQLVTERPITQPSLSSTAAIVVNEGSAARPRFEKAFNDFRSLFPIALCYTKIVPVDEVVTLTLFYREDDHLRNLMLNDAERAQLDGLWDELHFVSHDALTLVDAYEQLWQYATQDADPSAFEPLREPILKNADAFRGQLKRAEPLHLESILNFADNAFRRPITDIERTELRELYQRLRSQELSHEDAIRLTFARVLVSPAFLYRVERPTTGTKSSPISDWELATRLSYFLWSSQPDQELRQLAAANKLHEPDQLAAQTRRMLQDPKARRLATEFACQWLHIYDFNQLDEKSESHFPTFNGLRSDMYEESIQFFTRHFQSDRPFLELFDADYTFLNEALAKHYGIDGVVGPQWRRVEGVRNHHRGGVLTMASALAKQSGASRTSPILRGNWLSEVLLGEKLPRPPKNVPPLAETAPEGMTERQMTERHSSDPACNKCHLRVDPFGYALESFDAIGRFRERDANGLPIDTKTKLADSTALNGLEDLRDYLTKNRRNSIARQFSRKLLGYALGRSVQLSDEPLLEELIKASAEDNTGLQSIVQRIVASTQFKEIRGTNHE